VSNRSAKRPDRARATDAPLRPLRSSGDTWFRFAKMLERDVALRRRRRGIEAPYYELATRQRAPLVAIELDPAFGEVVPVAPPRLEALLGLAHPHHLDMRVDEGRNSSTATMMARKAPMIRTSEIAMATSSARSSRRSCSECSGGENPFVLKIVGFSPKPITCIRRKSGERRQQRHAIARPA
jgi:hypothetical protein